MKMISFATMKGGTGKTTTCTNIACVVAQTKKVLIIDCDPQCNISINFGFNAYDRNQPSLATIFESPATNPLNIAIFNPIPELPNLDLIPASLFLHKTETRLVTSAAKEVVIKKYISRNIDFFQFYDYIFFDTSPSMSLINQNAFVVSDDIILVCDPDSNSALGAEFFVELWDEIRLSLEHEEERKVSALILNNVENTNISSTLDSYFANHELFTAIKLENKIPHTTRFKEATSARIPVYALDVKKKDLQSKEKAVSSIYAVVDELYERGVL